MNQFLCPVVKVWSSADENPSYASFAAAFHMCSDPVVTDWVPGILTAKSLKERLESQEKTLSSLGNPKSLAMFISRAQKTISTVEALEMGDVPKFRWESPDALERAQRVAEWAVDTIDVWIVSYENTKLDKISTR